jgi:3-hydroxyisobutyrate dehydrogenase-like beta-hydroxyacid dehydrogenase
LVGEGSGFPMEEIGMATIGFIGLGNMGAPMAANLVKARHRVAGFDLAPKAIEALAAEGGRAASSAAEAAAAGEIVITMLPAGPQGRSVYLGEGGILAHAGKEALLIGFATCAAGRRDDGGSDPARRGGGQPLPALCRPTCR